MLRMDFSRINRSKAIFHNIYASDDPRAYFSILGDLDYMIPDVAEPVVRQILAAKASATGLKPVVLDVALPAFVPRDFTFFNCTTTLRSFQ